jgi:curved DNA-binding protein CbpA
MGADDIDDDVDGEDDDIDDTQAAPAPLVQENPAVPKKMTLDDVLNASNTFGAMGVPVPEWDELGAPVWLVSDAELKMAFKKMSILTHPDKNRDRAEEAQRAFESVQQAFASLSSVESRDTILLQFVARAREAEAQAKGYEAFGADNDQSLEQLVVLKRKQEALKKKQVEMYQQQVQQKMKERKKRQRDEEEQKARKKVVASSDSDSEDDRRRKKIQVKHKKHRRGVFF